MKCLDLQRIVYFFLSLFLIACGEKDWRQEMEKEEANYLLEVKKTQEVLISNKKDSYIIPNSSNSVESALRAFYQEAISQEDPEKIASLMSEKELREIFYPHVLGTGTALDSNPFPKYEEMIRGRRKLGLAKFNEVSLSQKNRIGNKFEYNIVESRNYGPIIGHKIDYSMLKGNGGSIKSEAVKMVIEHKGQFKVAVIAP